MNDLKVFQDGREKDLAAWTRNREALAKFFTGEEIDRLDAARGSVDLAAGTIVYCVYENPFGRSGGIFAVAENYSLKLHEQGRPVVVLSPYHTGLKTAPDASSLKRIGGRRVPFYARSVPVEIYEHFHKDVRWVLLRADGFFDAEGGEGRMDPYVHSDPSKLVRDSLFASAAVPHVLAELGLQKDLIVHVQDWELASTALTIKRGLLGGLVKSAAVVLTSHNPYDQPLRDDLLRAITDHPYWGSGQGQTVYQLMIPLFDAPVTTVSRTFARELTSDPLQTGHFADHLQQVYRAHGVLGVDNGLFGAPKAAFSERGAAEAQRGDASPILKEKEAKRKAMLEILGEYGDPRIVGSLDGGDGRPLAELAAEIPVFMMFGRLDPGQKGFDVLARAIEALPRGRARYVITPIVAGASWAIDDLAQLAQSRAGEVVVYPFRMEKGYMETMAGATFAVLPSLYEPFGAATEPYLAGTPVVARATGGLLQQVVDADSDPTRGTGLLYREETPETGDQWRRVQNAQGAAGRMGVPVYGAMVAALAAALTRACDIYRAEPETYGRMLANLFGQAQLFSWERTAGEYERVYQMAVKP